MQLFLCSINIICLLKLRSKCFIRQNIYDTTSKNAEFKRDLKPCVPQKSNEEEPNGTGVSEYFKNGICLWGGMVVSEATLPLVRLFGVDSVAWQNIPAVRRCGNRIIPDGVLYRQCSHEL